MIVPVLLCVAFFTLAERQIMASMQRRFGPQVSYFSGVLQPFWDGLKLGVKEPILPELSSSGAFSAAPMISFVLSQVAWCGIFLSDSAFQGLVIMTLSTLAVYGMILAGWSSNSKYAFLGCLRSVALMVSYELSFGSALLSVALFTDDGTGISVSTFTVWCCLVKVLFYPLVLSS
jgi:NADH:ubiquinone oxidoreductase subunit H